MKTSLGVDCVATNLDYDAVKEVVQIVGLTDPIMNNQGYARVNQIRNLRYESPWRSHD
jgi:hypothetical protein